MELMWAYGVPCQIEQVAIFGGGDYTRIGKSEIIYEEISWHAYPIIYVPNYGWIPIDITFHADNNYYRGAKVTRQVIVFGRMPTPANQTEVASFRRFITENRFVVREYLETPGNLPYLRRMIDVFMSGTVKMEERMLKTVTVPYEFTPVLNVKLNITEAKNPSEVKVSIPQGAPLGVYLAYTMGILFWFGSGIVLLVSVIYCLVKIRKISKEIKRIKNKLLVKDGSSQMKAYEENERTQGRKANKANKDK